MRTFETLINLANTNLDQAEECNAFDASNAYAQLSISYALIAIAGELHRMNERQADIEIDRQDLLEARKSRLSDGALVD